MATESNINTYYEELIESLAERAFDSVEDGGYGFGDTPGEEDVGLYTHGELCANGVRDGEDVFFFHFAFLFFPFLNEVRVVRL